MMGIWAWASLCIVLHAPRALQQLLMVPRLLPLRYAYTLAAVRPTNMGNALAKSDLQQGSVKLWHEAGCAPGEPAFVAAPGGASEDAGVVLDLVMGADGRSFLLVLDAASWTELARAQLTAGMPYRFHGTFVPA
jgi:carotenoid cleavage dioxygenase-like enzyme